MSETMLFADALAAVDAATALRTEADQPELQMLRQAGKSPTNQEILDAARRQYRANSAAVDACARDGRDYVRTPHGGEQVLLLNGYDWASNDATPIAPACRRVAGARELATAVAEVDKSPALATMTFGVSLSAQFIVGGEGGVGVAVGLADGAPTVGVGYAAGKLGLDIDLAHNLQIGLWSTSPANLAGPFFGLEVNLDLGVGVSLGIFLNPVDLTSWGFSVGVGIGIGGGATVVGGYTWVF